MNKQSNSKADKFSEDDVELKRFIEQGNKLKWTWIIGVLVIMVCLMLGDTAENLLAVVVACYIALTTSRYFKSVSSGIS